MKNDSRSHTNAQQAPCSGPRHAVRSLPLQVASMIRNRTSGGMTQTSSAMTRMVSTAFIGDENRLARIQPIGPVAITGGAWSATLWLRTKISSSVTATRTIGMFSGVDIALAPRIRDVGGVPVHHRRGDEAERQVDRKRDRHHFDGLPGLIEHSA